jgi:periplasmic protein TonB
MSTPALQLPIRKASRHQRRRRRHAWSQVPLQWHDIPVAQSQTAGGRRGRPAKRWLIALAVVAVLVAHALGVWFGDRLSLASAAKPRQTTLAIELVRPPPPPKIEPPPTPPPPKKTPPRTPPPIQTVAAAPSEAPVTAPVETVAAVEPAPPAPPAPAPAPVKPAFGGIGYRNNPAPDYPAQAVRQGWQGTVLLRVKVLQSGAVDSIEVLKSSGRKLLDEAAIETVNRWVFAPSTQGGAPIDGFATVPIEFKLDS